MRTRFLLLWLAFVAPSCTATAQPVVVNRIEIVEKGIYDAEDKQRIEDGGVAGNNRREASNIRLLEETSNIPARKDVLFGTKFKIIGEPVGQPVELILVTKFPGDGLRDPRTSKLQIANVRSPEFFTIGDVHFRGYRLEADWELVPGAWVFEFLYNDRKLALQEFLITEQGPETGP
jgi:hypothetical protein